MQKILDWVEQKGMKYVWEDFPLDEEELSEKMINRVLESHKMGQEELEITKKGLTNYYFYSAGELQIDLAKKEEFFKGLGIEKSFWGKFEDSLPYVIIEAGRFTKPFDCTISIIELEKKIETDDSSIYDLLELIEPGYHLKKVFEEEKAKRKMKGIIYYFHCSLVAEVEKKMACYRTELEDLVFECVLKKYQKQKAG